MQMESSAKRIDRHRVCRLYRVGILGTLLGFIGDVLLAFAKGRTPYPKCCLIFFPLFSPVISAVTAPFGGSAVLRAIGAERSNCRLSGCLQVSWR